MTTDSIPDAAAIMTPDKLGDDPRVTPRAAVDAVAAATAPAPVSIPDRDGHGVAFDPARHERRLVSLPGGTRWKVRADAARSHKAAPTGRGPGRPRKIPQEGTTAPEPAPVPQPAPIVAPAAPVAAPIVTALPASMSIVAPDAPAPAPDAPAAAAPLTEAECLIAAKAVTNGALAGARMWRGDHWRADQMEHTELVGSLARVWSHYGLPKVGPLVEWGLVVITFCMSAEQRRKDLAALWRWMLGKKTPAPVESDGG